MRNIEEQVKKAFCYQILFWPFTVWTNCFSDLKNFVNSWPSASNFKSFSRSLEQFFLTIAQRSFNPQKVSMWLHGSTWVFSSFSCSFMHNFSSTLESGIEVGPTVINLGFFSRPYGLIRDYIKVIYYIGHVYLRPHVYSFCQIFQALCWLHALRLFRTLE